MKKVLALLLTVMFSAVALSSRAAEGQSVNSRAAEKRAGKVVRSYRREQGGQRPA